MIGGTGKAPSSGFSPVTGIGAVKVLAVNPSNAEYKEITGRDMPYTLKYDITVLGMDQKRFRPVDFLVHNAERNVYAFVNFLIGADDDVAKSGKVQSMDGVGSTAYVTPGVTGEYAWFDSTDCKPMKVGECALQKFLQTYLKYDTKGDGANWMVDMASAGITAEAIFEGDVSGLRKLIEWANTVTESHPEVDTLGVLFEVKKTPKKDKETKEEIPGEFNFNQRIHTDRSGKTFYFTKDGLVTSGAFKRLKDYSDAQEGKGYKVTKNLFTYKFQDFVEAESKNSEPTGEVEEATEKETSDVDFF